MNEQYTNGVLLSYKNTYGYVAGWKLIKQVSLVSRHDCGPMQKANESMH
jgi:hypothetical protein